ncbi:TetR/AcrR family transcriptional regulator [Streptomyces sp. NPDC058464]|uniref:TetR/AcrR family transcriptional regulator n=1 Tax=Streptomyces sp. NPDC058464 TaxID=3346511 RepID=UPI00364BD97B
MTGEPERPVIRRPRMTPDREVELLSVALGALREVGYGALTMDLIASRGRCSKATLYRQWGNKPKMIAAAVTALRPVNPGSFDTGTLRGDLLSLVSQLAMGADQDTTLIAALHHALLTDATLAGAFRTAMLDPEEEDLARIVQRAVKRGELAHRPAAAEFLPQMLFSAVVARPMFRGVPADPEYLARFVDQALLPALHHS